MATESSGLTGDQTAETQSGKVGLRILTNNAISVNSITVDTTSGTPPTKVYVLNSGQGVIATASIIGSTGTFSSSVSLSNATIYFLAMDKDGASYHLRRDSTASSYFTHAGTNWDWTAGLNWNGVPGTGDNLAFAIHSADVSVTTNVTPTPAAVPITAAVLAPTIVIDDITTPSTLALNLTVKAPTIVIGLDKIVSIASPLALTATLNTGSVIIKNMTGTQGTVSTRTISKLDIPAGIGDIQNLVPESSTVLIKNRVGLEL